MKPKLCIYPKPNYLIRTAIEREQKQFIKIAFAVHLSAAISAERYRSDSGALKSAVFNFVFFVMLKNKIEQSAKRNSLLKNLTDRTFENRWSRYKELGKKVPQAYRVYVEDTFLPCDAGDARIFSKEMTHTENQGDNDEQKAKRYYYHSDHLGSAQFVTDWRGKQYEHIEYTPYGELWIEEVAAGLDKLPFRFTGKELDEETGLYYYGARYLDPKYSRWLSGDPALNDYIPSPGTDPAKLAGMGGVYNTVNLHVYHYAGNNPVKYTDPDGKILRIAGSNSYKNQVMSVLKKLDPNVKINMRTGIVTTSSTNNSAGAKLIRNLQVSKNTVTIMNDSSIGTAPKSRKKAETPGIGSDSIVYFSINVKLSNDYFIRDENGNIEKAKHTPAEIVLGHELIHGLHYADGTGDNSTDDYTFITSGFQDGKYKSGEVVFKGGLFHDKYPREEARTIGVGEFSNDPITENALRRQLKYNERLTH